MVNNFLMGGKLGDFLHSMYAVQQLSLKYHFKANVYMYDIGWERGIENTFAELSPILLQQNYIETFSMLTNYELDPVQTPVQNSPIVVHGEKLLNEGFINLGEYIRSPLLYRACWSEIYSNAYGFDIGSPHQWMTYNKIDPALEDKVIIHRRYNPVRLNQRFPYKKIIADYQDQLIFASPSETDYEKFPYRSFMPFLKLNTLEDMFTVVNSCRMIVSNLTGITTIAHALDKLRIIELPDTPDAIHCIGEENYSRNLFWYLTDEVNNLT